MRDTEKAAAVAAAAAAAAAAGGGKRAGVWETTPTAGREGDTEGTGRRKEAEIMFMKRPHYVTL